MEPFLCGIFGAFGSFSGKLALSDDSPVRDVCIPTDQLPESYCNSIVITSRLLLFILMLISNGLMVSNFLTALEKKSSLFVVLTSSSINVILTGILGQSFLDEPVRENWYCGALLMLMGVLFVTLSQDSKKSSG